MIQHLTNTVLYRRRDDRDWVCKSDRSGRSRIGVWAQSPTSRDLEDTYVM